jgi:hypothetical protein
VEKNLTYPWAYRREQIKHAAIPKIKFVTFFLFCGPIFILPSWKVFRIRIRFNADPDPAFYFIADPDLDPGSQINADPDPGQTLSSLKV